uniref:Uncharacterized protein n=1 Tax=Acrobeloides nanus TaxID=290746 RepID=A0A914EDX2_9BILA
MLPLYEPSSTKVIFFTLIFGLIFATVFYKNFQKVGHYQRSQNPALPHLIHANDQWRFENTNDSIGDCNFIQDTQLFDALHPETVIGRGWNKKTLKINQTAVKKLNLKGVALVQCLNEAGDDFMKEYNCIENAVYKLNKEVSILLALQHIPNTPKLLAYCIPYDFIADAHKLAIVTDIGTPLDNLFLIQSNWETRLQILHEIIDFMERIQPFILQDLRRQQFMMIDNKPVYIDFDDVTIEENCPIFNATDNESCVQVSSNIARRLYEEFVDEFFWLGQPKYAHQHLEELKKSYAGNHLDMQTLKYTVKRLNQNLL